jgi:hypothetical protein
METLISKTSMTFYSNTSANQKQTRKPSVKKKKTDPKNVKKPVKISRYMLI